MATTPNPTLPAPLTSEEIELGGQTVRFRDSLTVVVPSATFPANGPLGKDGSVQLLGNEAYDIRAFLSNQFGAAPTRSTLLNPDSILYLRMQQTATNWVTGGEAVILYTPWNPDYNTTGQTANTPGNPASSNPFVYSLDGFDTFGFNLTLKAVPSSTGISDPQSQFGSKNIFDTTSPFWSLRYLFSIYDLEDLTLENYEGAGATLARYVRIYFRDLKYQILEQTANVSFSTADPFDTNGADPIEIDGLTCHKTGDILQGLFQKGLGTHPVGQSLGMRFSVQGLSATSQNTLLDFAEWEQGSSVLFYTKPCNTTFNEAIDYVYAQHVASDEKDVCIFTSTKQVELPNGEQVDQLGLVSVSKLFQDSTSGSAPGKLQIEHLFVDMFSESTASVTNLYRAPISNVSDEIDGKFAKHSIIKKFTFVEMDPKTFMHETVSRFVVSNDYARSGITIEATPLVESFQTVNDLYVSKLYKPSATNNVFSVQAKKSNRTLDPQGIDSDARYAFSKYSGDGYKANRAVEGIQRLLKTGLFLNSCVVFSCLGLPSRQPGKFIGIDNMDGYKLDDRYADLLFGQWFIINVEHIIEQGRYYNVVYAVKCHAPVYAGIQFDVNPDLLDRVSRTT